MFDCFLQIFAIQFYGECWIGDSSKVKYDRFGAADKSRCSAGVGGKNINAVYEYQSDESICLQVGNLLIVYQNGSGRK